MAYDGSNPATGAALASSPMRSNFEGLRAALYGRNLIRDSRALNWPDGDASDPAHFTTQGGAGAAIARETSTIYGSEGFSMKLTGATAAAEYLQQRILTTSSFCDALQGESVSAGCWVWCASASSARIGIYDGVGTTWCTTRDGYTDLDPDYHPGDSAWHWLEVTRPLSASATQLIFRMETAQAIVSYFDAPTMLLGAAAPAAWIPSPWAYYVVGPGTQQSTISVTTYINGWRLPVDLPVIVLRSTLQAKTAPTGSAAIYDVNKDGTSMYSTKPQLAISATFGAAAPDGTYANRCLDQDDVLSVDCDQVGSTVAGEEVTPKITGLCFPHPLAEVAPATVLTETD